MSAETRAARARAAIAGLYCITGEPLSRGRDSVQVVREMLAGGAHVIQYREKDMPMKKQYEQCLAIRALTRAAGALLVVDDHVHLAMAVGADGVHVGQDDLPPEAVRGLVGEEMLIGLSTHSQAQARDALARGVDYIGVGPIFETHTKADVVAPVGLSYLDFAVRNMPLPFVAIGGIKTHRLPALLTRGARCAALVSEIVSADDIAGKVRALRQIFEQNGRNGA